MVQGALDTLVLPMSPTSAHFFPLFLPRLLPYPQPQHLTDGPFACLILTLEVSRSDLHFLVIPISGSEDRSFTPGLEWSLSFLPL